MDLGFCLITTFSGLYINYATCDMDDKFINNRAWRRPTKGKIQRDTGLKYTESEQETARRPFKILRVLLHFRDILRSLNSRFKINEFNTQLQPPSHPLNPTPDILWYTRVVSVYFTEPNCFMARESIPDRAEILVDWVKWRKIPRVARDVWIGVSGTINHNVKLVLVKHPGTDIYSLLILRNQKFRTKFVISALWWSYWMALVHG